MANTRTLQLSFAGGEVTPEFSGKIDDAKFKIGLATCRNFVVKPHGPTENRAGFRFVRAVKDSAKRTRLLPFTYSTTQTMVIELGAGYFRFHTGGATLLSGGSPYEVANPYAESDLFDIHYVQSADVLTLVHPGYAPRELRRLGPTSWALTTINFAAPIAAPGAPTITPYLPASAGVNPDTKTDMFYVVTSVGDDGVSESAASTAASASNNIYVTGATNTISWSAVTGASRYRVYKLQGGIYGYIGQTTGTSIVDDNIAPDLATAPPIYDPVFSGSGEYPGAVSYFEQRRCFAGSINKPQDIWMTRSGTESNMSYSLPSRAEDRISFKVNTREANTIRHIVPLSQLVLLTSSAELRVSSGSADALTPTSFSVAPQSYNGANNVQPIIVNNAMLYASARGGHVRELGYSWQASAFVTGDLSVRAPHLFDRRTILDMAYAKAPYPIGWFVSSSGELLGLTYMPEQQIGAWHRHDTDGVFESCAAVAEGDEDVLYVVVRRTINGASVRYVERMASRQFATQSDAFFVDAGLTYSGAPATSISVLGHLEGKTVSILADGAVHPQRVVTSGAITLDQAASVVHVGLPITADLQTLPQVFQIDGAFGQGRPKNINAAWIRIYESLGVFVGPSVETLKEAKLRTTEPYGSPPNLKTGEIRLPLTPSWTDGGQVVIRQADPLPLTVVNLTLEVSVGG
ncbi:MAG: hypothetical protein ACRCTX_26575 [Afipia sp.]